MLRIEIEIVIGIHKETRYALSEFEGTKKVSGFSVTRPDEIYEYLKKRDIEDICYSANATPIPDSALEAVARMKEIVAQKQAENTKI